ncbi:hypothetical protein D3C76_1766160 [compost metagenome]
MTVSVMMPSLKNFLADSFSLSVALAEIDMYWAGLPTPFFGSPLPPAMVGKFTKPSFPFWTKFWPSFFMAP